MTVTKNQQIRTHEYLQQNYEAESIKLLLFIRVIQNFAYVYRFIETLNNHRYAPVLVKSSEITQCVKYRYGCGRPLLL